MTELLFLIISFSPPIILLGTFLIWWDKNEEDRRKISKGVVLLHALTVLIFIGLGIQITLSSLQSSTPGETMGWFFAFAVVPWILIPINSIGLILVGILRNFCMVKLFGVFSLLGYLAFAGIFIVSMD